MPNITIQITEARRIKDNIIFTAKQGNNVITHEVNIGEFDTWQKFAEWIINQEPDFVLMPDKLKTIQITFHNETSGEGISRVVDNVTVS